MLVPEPSVDETTEILKGLRERYEAHHKLRYTDEALEAASKYASQYISDRFLPDKVPTLSGFGFVLPSPLRSFFSVDVFSSVKAVCGGLLKLFHADCGL